MDKTQVPPWSATSQPPNNCAAPIKLCGMAIYSQLNPSLLTEHPSSITFSNTNQPVVSTNICKLSEDCCNIIAHMLTLCVLPNEISVLVGVSLHSIYHVQEVCQGNGGTYTIQKNPSNAGWPRLISEEDIMVKLHSRYLYRPSLQLFYSTN